MIRLSVVIIAFNEEKNIGRCLDSVNEIADDIVVVDSFSSDRTESICKEKGARFEQHRFEGHIEQKNFAITRAKYPHILSLDADEALSDELKKSISAVKNNWQLDGYYMNRRNNYCGKWLYHGSWYPDRKLRLWDSRKGKWSGTNPHDKYEMQQDAKTGLLKGDILHYTVESIEAHRRQIDKFTTIAASQLRGRGRKTNMITIVFKPAFTFIRDYFFKMGFLDGYYGLVAAGLSARYTFLKYAKLRDLNKNPAA